MTSLLAAGILGGIASHLFGDNPSPWYIIPFLVLLLPLFLGFLFLLGLIFKTAWDSWALFRFLRQTQGTYFACTNCGYDLRHKPDRCPECGQRVWFRRRRKTNRPQSPPSTAETLEIASQPPGPPDMPNTSAH